MRRFIRSTLFIGAVIVALDLNESGANTLSLLPGYTGGFGEQDCRECHMDTPNGAAQITLNGLPERYQAGRRYSLTLTFTYAAMERAGFQLAARFKDSSQAGRLMADGARVELSENVTSGLTFAHHSEQGLTLSAPGHASWHFIWHAPSEADGPVVFNAAVNGANYDDSEFGDAAFVRAWTVED